LWLHVGFRWCILPLFLEKDSFLSTFPAHKSPKLTQFLWNHAIVSAQWLHQQRPGPSHCRFWFCI
jgi:hypothetical protein